jgi:hypothetical protein
MSEEGDDGKKLLSLSGIGSGFFVNFSSSELTGLTNINLTKSKIQKKGKGTHELGI